MRHLPYVIALIPVTAAAQPSNPANSPKWVVNYSPESCEVLRPRVDGQNGLLLRMRPYSDFYELKIIGAPIGKKPAQEIVHLSVPAASDRFPQYASFGDTPDKKYGLVETSVSSEQVGQAAQDGMLTARGKKLGKVSVSTVGLSKAMIAADKCIDDLATQWGAPRTWRTDPKAVADVRGVFTASDYPTKMIDQRQTGSLRTLLGVGIDGRVTSCRPISLVGHKMFGEVTCEILRKRARFVPAKDATGTAVPSFALSPPLHWRMSW